MTRRDLLQLLGATAYAAAGSAVREASAAPLAKRAAIATNTFPWVTFAARAGQDIDPLEDAMLAEIAASQITTIEPIVERVSDFNGLERRLRAHGLTMRSVYIEAELYRADRVAEGIESAVGLAAAAYDLGAEIIVTNPAPISWDEPEDKDDDQLRIQAAALNQLGERFREIGLTLAYHNHEIELRQGGREFHHMLTATDSEVVKLCLDSHWIFRGCGASEVAVFDALAHYADRIVELHLRQSFKDVWSESFSIHGDIDYGQIFRFLSERAIVPHYVLEQAVEEDSPRNFSAVEAHRRSLAALKLHWSSD